MNLIETIQFSNEYRIVEIERGRVCIVDSDGKEIRTLDAPAEVRKKLYGHRRLEYER